MRGVLDATNCFVVSRGWKQGWVRVCHGDSNIWLTGGTHIVLIEGVRERPEETHVFVFLFTCFTPTFSSSISHFLPLSHATASIILTSSHHTHSLLHLRTCKNLLNPNTISLPHKIFLFYCCVMIRISP